MPDAPHPAADVNRRFRVLIGGDTFAPDVNGAAKFAERLAAGLVERGHDVHVVAPNDVPGPNRSGTEEHEGQHMMVHRLRSWRWRAHPWLRYALPWRIEQNAARILDEVKPDVVHFQSHIVVGRGLAREAAKRGIRIVGTNHFMPENALQFTPFIGALREPAIRMSWKAAARTFGLAEAVTTPTRKAADYLEKYTELRNVHPISCGLHIEHYTPNMKPRTENVVLFIGRVEAEKHIEELLRAAARLDSALDVKVEIIGDGEQRPALRSRNVQNRAIRACAHVHGGLLGKSCVIILRQRATFFSENCKSRSAAPQKKLLHLHSVRLVNPFLTDPQDALPITAEKG